MFFSFLSLFFLLSCDVEKKTDDLTKESKNVIDSSKIKITNESEKLILDYGLEQFCNMEQIVYCVPIPLDEFNMNNTEEQERGQFLFTNKLNKKYDLELKGLFRSDTSMNIENYFKNSYPGEEAEPGKVIEEKKIVTENSCFYAKGYWSNFYYESRFIEITWFRKEDVVTLQVSFDIKDTTLWYNRLKTIIKCSSYPD